jgi:hypothetical protein
MKTALRTTRGAVAGVELAFVLVIAVELFSAVVHPVPPGFTGTMDEMRQHVARSRRERVGQLPPDRQRLVVFRAYTGDVADCG